MEQLPLKLSNPRRLNVDRILGAQSRRYKDEYYIQYIGEAVQQFDGTWRCLANVGGALCVVEVSITEGGVK